MSDLIQTPSPGSHLLYFCGDILTITLRCPGIKSTDHAYLCTNIGNAALKRMEIIELAEQGITSGDQDWRNIPMLRVDAETFTIRLALTEEGHFEFKGYILSEDSPIPRWVGGDNVHLNVDPAPFSCSNTVYCAFVRQFGMNKNKFMSSLPAGMTQSELSALDANSYSVIPPSGTFRDLIRELDHIVNRLKCRIIHLLPINPTPTVYARMGRYGSPYASLDFTAVDPALAEFDRKATPLDQFIELVDAVHRKDAKLFIDIAINHTGWASKIHEEHPDWLVHEADGTIHSPGAWGVVWGDLTELDHHKPELWKYLADVFLTWCSRGVDGFRCDAGYMIPAPAWQYIIARVRDEYPETIFLLEGLGGDPAVTVNLLDSANMNWAYSELFQNYSRPQIEGYLNYAWKQSASNGLMIHYAETHDNSRLAAVSHRYAKMRTAISALTSSNGAFGFANGVEWFAEEKIDVHESSALNWGATDNQNDFIARLNVILALHPAFHNGAHLSFIDSHSPNSVIWSRSDAAMKHHLILIANLNCDTGCTVQWDASEAPFDTDSILDLLSGQVFNPARTIQHKRSLDLHPGQVICLTDEEAFFQTVLSTQNEKELRQAHLDQQEAAAMVLRVLCARNRSLVLTDDVHVADLTDQLLKSPESFLETMYENAGEVPYVHWEWPHDLRREVMLPPDHCMLITAPFRFRFSVFNGKKIMLQVNGLADAKGRYFAIIPQLPKAPENFTRYQIRISVYTDHKLERNTASILLLPRDTVTPQLAFGRNEVYNMPRTFLQANGRGAIMHRAMELSKFRSRYDAILLANLNPNYPEDRHIMWRRIRILVVYHARMQEVRPEHIKKFYMAKDGGAVWNYEVPVGNGSFIELLIKMEIVQDENAVLVTVHRLSCGKTTRRLRDESAVRIAIRPDIEDRNFHSDTKASMGPEQYWPHMIVPHEKSFEFRAASDRNLVMTVSKGGFKFQPEWSYMNFQVNEASRGLEANSDLYSPGLFRFDLTGDDTAYLSGQIITSEQTNRIHPQPIQKEPFAPCHAEIEAILLHSLGEFVVKRDNLKTVIAGYPWFLDWGRDTLIAARGLIAAEPFRDDVKKILLQFAKFAENGTIPNMISGANADNRDTSDAPLWLFTACADLCRVERSKDFLNQMVRGKQTVLDILVDLANGLIKGTPNGIRFDAESGLIFSPPHFTWMDTNYPAGTPREGYPVEIQALWFAALRFLAESVTDPKESVKWAELSEQVRKSILTLFTLPGHPYLSDCLHCRAGEPANAAIADDHLRPNQLYAITLGVIQGTALRRSMLRACESLLIPGAIRSLADHSVNYLMPIPDGAGRNLNNPVNPYWGHYEGNEDTRRKPAYHNGTAWTWQFPAFAEAYMMTYGEAGKNTARSILSSMELLMNTGCMAQVPEILDGDYPHTQRGCDAQAWGISEFYRVWKLLHS